MGEGQMKVTADTNVLIRAAVQDDLLQAAKILAEVDLVGPTNVKSTKWLVCAVWLEPLVERLGV